MEAIKYLITFFLKIAFGLFFVALVWWLVALLFPSISYTSVSTLWNEKKDFLPSPRTYSNAFNLANKDIMTPKVYVPNAPFNGYGNAGNNVGYSYSQVNYIVYTNDGMKTVDANGNEVSGEVLDNPSQQNSSPSPSNMNTKRDFIRNLSIYEGGHIYTGLSFIGEAKNEMFKQGKFSVVMLDAKGMVVGVTQASATTDWAIPGWVRFEAKISHVLPNRTPCTMIFEQGRDQYSNPAQLIRVAIPVLCN